jgi:EAL and modified HD-GYP domain-containing signal transduction protein
MTAEPQDILLARQPIYDTNKEIIGYELLFRENTDIPSIGIFDGNRATSRVLLSLFTESDITTITHGLPAFINFTAELIHNPPFFDPKSMIIEVLEDICITDKIISSLKILKQKGFTLALDDFVMDEKYRPLLALVDIIKLELPAMDEAELEKTIKTLKQYKVKILAEKIETPELFNRCRDLGCDMFQGYFLAKPEIMKGKKIAASKMAILSLISEIQSPEIDMNGLSKIISRDPALSFKLLKLINSAAFKRRNTIDSIHRAVTLLGLDKIKSWASLLALSKLDDKPESLHYTALVRALMCEKLAEYIHLDQKDRFYTVGLLSCLDAFFDQEITEVIKHISLDTTINNALLNYEGEAGLALHTTLNFEKSQWHKIKWQQLSQYELSVKLINEIYFDATKLALDMSS